MKSNIKRYYMPANSFLFIVILFFINTAHAQEFNEMMQRPGEYNFYDIKTKAQEHFDKIGRGRGTGFNQYKRWEMFMESRVYPSGNMINPSQKALQAYQDYIQSSYYSNLGSRMVSHGYWESLGPTSHVRTTGWNGGSGRVNCLAFDPANMNIVYAGTPSGGLWKSTNAGVTWTPMTDGMPLLGISGIAIHPTNSNIIYILTGDGDGLNTSCIGVLKTTDGGITWQNTSLSFGVATLSRGFKLVIHPTNPEILFAVTNYGIYKTSDGGINWAIKQGGFITDIEFKPGTPSTMYAVSNGNFYRSTNTGDSWNVVYSILPSSGFNRIAISVTTAAPGYVYALFGGSGPGLSTYSGLYRSTDSGQNFSLRSNTPNILTDDTLGQTNYNIASYALSMAVSPVNANQVIVGTLNNWVSTNGGTTWALKSYWAEDNLTHQYVHGDIHALEYSASIIWVGSDGGVYKSTDIGTTWTDVSAGLVISQYYNLCVQSNLIDGGTQDNGSNRMTTTNSIANHTRGGDGFECIINPSNTNILYQTDQGTIHKSTNGGSIWTNITPSGTSPNYWFCAMLMHPTLTGTLYIAHSISGSSRIHRTTTSGSSWTLIAPTFTLQGSDFSLAQGTSNVNVMYFANGSEIKRSDDINVTLPSFTTVSNNLPLTLAKITGICVDPLNAARAWVTLSGYSASNKVFYTNNSGGVWTNVTGAMPNVPVNCIAYDPGSADGLYIGTDIGIFYRDNNIGDWIPFMNGLPSCIVKELEVEDGVSKIYAATFARGIWRSDLYTACPTDYSLAISNDPSNPNYTGIQHYEASNSITSSRIITGGVGTDVTYLSGNYIDLTTGFHARANNLFTANNGSCNAIMQTLQTPASGIYVYTNLKNENEKPSVISFDALIRNKINVFPNPSQGKFNIEFNALENDLQFDEIIITDASGKTIRNFRLLHVKKGLQCNLYVELGDVASGQYHFIARNGNETEKIVLIKND